MKVVIIGGGAGGMMAALRASGVSGAQVTLLERQSRVGRKLLACAAARGLTPRGMLRHIYLEGPPQHKDPKKFITQVLLPVCED